MTTDPTRPDMTPPPYTPAGASPPTTFPGKTLGIVAIFVAIFFSIIGLILGIVALVQSRRAGHKNLPAVWAIIIGAVLAVVGVIALVAIVGAVLAGITEIAAACAELGPGEHVYNGVTITCN